MFKSSLAFHPESLHTLSTNLRPWINHTESARHFQSHFPKLFLYKPPRNPPILRERGFCNSFTPSTMYYVLVKILLAPCTYVNGLLARFLHGVPANLSWGAAEPGEGEDLK